ncbi:MAG: autotransporter outer membrane beta-barrel domain-containing protein [Pseudomonadota bacterium]
MKIKSKKNLLQTAIQLSFAALTATAAMTLIISPNLVQGAIDGYNNDGYGSDNVRPPETPEEEAEVKRQETEQEAVSDAILRKNVSTTVRTTISHIKQLHARTNEFSIANAAYAQYSTSGLNAGSSVSGMAGWLTIPYSDFEDSSFTNNNSNFDGKSINYLAGMDLVLNTRLALGASLGYEDSEITFKNGSTTDTDGWFGTVYGAYNFSEVTAYLIAGYGSGENAPSNASSYDSDSHFITGGAMKDFGIGTNLALNLDAGYTYAESDSDSYASNGLIITPDGTILSQLHVNAEVAKIMEWGELYGLAETKFDLHDDDNALHDNGSFGMDLGLGIRFNANEAISGDVNVKKMFARKDEENVTITATIRYQF